MEFIQLHFSNPQWLWLGLVILFIWVAYFLCIRKRAIHHSLEKFIDSHLLPYLLINKEKKQSPYWIPLIIWTFVWALLTLALAGPRWDFREMETFSKDQSLVILLDLSRSMNTPDVNPSRLVRAKQKIEDLLNQSKGVKIGIIAFAADAHIITPLTDDTNTIRHLLPALDTDLVFAQGSKLSPALDMAVSLFDAEPGKNKALLIISDGGFEDASAIKTAKNVAEKGIIIHTMGLGTVEGGPILDSAGNIIKKQGLPIISKLEKDKFSEISRLGKGYYLEGDHGNRAEDLILSELEQRAEEQATQGKNNKIWEEGFFWLIIPTLPFILWWFRTEKVLALIFLLFFPAFTLQAEVADYFKNTEQLGAEACEVGDYETASSSFQDPYRRGVSLYKAGLFSEAEKMFRESFRPEVASSAAYNLGNALVQQNKLKEAAAAYEEVLKQWPDHTKAKANLDLVRRALEEQKQEDQDNNSKDSNDQDSDGDDSSKEKEKNRQPPHDKDEPDNSKKEDEKEKDVSQKDDEQRQDHDSEHEVDSMEEKEEPHSVDQKDEKPESHPRDTQGAKAKLSEEDLDADMWLNRISNDQKKFMKNKFYIESKKNGTTEGIDPW